MSSKTEYRFFYKRNLPHIQPVDAVFFISYRLAFSLPVAFYRKLQTYRQEFENKLKLQEKLMSESKSKMCNNFNKKIFNLTDKFIANYIGSPQWLKNHQVANVIVENLFKWDDIRYELLCYCIMPNHVHILIKPLLKEEREPFSLARIMQAHKGYTASQSNKILKRRGQFWQYESYDHYVRDYEELLRIVRYILYNPVKAGFVNDHEKWQYNYVEPSVISL